MTIVMEPTRTGDVEWVQQQPGLWAGRRGGRPVGTIEVGRRCTFICTEGIAHGGFRSLEEAQRAALTIAPGTRVGCERGSARALIASGSAALISTTGFVLTLLLVVR